MKKQIMELLEKLEEKELRLVYIVILELVRGK